MHARAKSLSSTPSTYYVPVDLVEPLMAAVVVDQLDGKEIAMTILT
jgi:hypothetical protein